MVEQGWGRLLWWHPYYGYVLSRRRFSASAATSHVEINFWRPR